MRKLLGLTLLWIAFIAPDVVQAASRFAVCTVTCTWDNTDTSMWCATDTGCTGASAPTSADDVTLNANTCVGGVTCTITTFAGTISINTLIQSACTASTTGCILDASANNTSFTIAGTNCYVNTGSGTRTLNMGNGTWTCSGNSAVWNIVASMTLNSNSSTLAFTGAAASARSFTGGGKTYNIVTISAAGSNANTFTFQTGNNTFNTLTIAAPNRISSNTTTQTITTLTNVTGSSSQQVLFTTFNGNSTISSANNWTCEWCGIQGYTFSGGGTFSAPNSFNFGNNSGITITPPLGGSRFIGG